MANRAFLIANDSGDANSFYKEQQVIVASSYTIPVFWYSLYTKEDLCFRTDKWHNTNGEEIDHVIPGLIVQLDAGINRSLSREAVLFQYLPPELRIYFKQWKTLLSTINSSHIQLDTYELAMLLAEADIVEMLTTSVEVFDSNELELLTELFDGKQSLEFDSRIKKVVVHDFDRVGNDLRGYQWDVPVPW